MFFLKASDRFLRVAGPGEEVEFPRRGQTLSTESLKDPSIVDDLRGAHTAITADGERQETLRENLGLRDAAGLAVGEHFSLRTGTLLQGGCLDETNWKLSDATCVATT